MNQLTPNAKQQFFDDNGDPLVGGKLYTYIAGTTTPVATYQSKNGAANANPIILNSRGECNVWIPEGAFKFVLKDANDVTIWTVDDVASPQTPSGFFDMNRINDSSFDVPEEIGSSDPIQFSGQAPRNVVFIKSSGGAVTMTENPAIEAGNVFGQELTVYGVSDADTVTLPSTLGVKTNGDKVFQQHSTAKYMWNGTLWVEQGANNI